MSADHWAHCPRCHARALASFEDRERLIENAYGQVPISQFDQMRDALDRDRELHDEAEPTFREDYEFTGAEDGVVTAKYKGQCTKCGLKLEFEDDHEIPGLES